MQDTTTQTALKAQAKRLRKALAETGTEVSHSRALELVAQSIGARNWNTVAAQPQPSLPTWHIGQRVSGHYLGHAFTGRIHAASARSAGWHRLTIDFDTPVDVIKSAHFSSFRRRVSAVVGADGRTVEKTSDGKPHLALV
ncbi:hypothetical protein EGN72_09715 [Pseudorhodobacter sp. E13]|uniref:glyoxalase superfamily protein n=1 Tax=Pseudorhodobacter sp. E13 TaxID=2487931 RepID=UPI000F8ED405|nr:glyoxalase superfamily protein [Pseudorhodobacter sp. E13]RUS60514.1 hypothetical protein EGN72_09715 [Pseudorhodobacter sp. E13]